MNNMKYSRSYHGKDGAWYHDYNEMLAANTKYNQMERLIKAQNNQSENNTIGQYLADSVTERLFNAQDVYNNKPINSFLEIIEAIIIRIILWTLIGLLISFILYALGFSSEEECLMLYKNGAIIGAILGVIFSIKIFSQQNVKDYFNKNNKK